jgi:hypothetical protein
LVLRHESETNTNGCCGTPTTKILKKLFRIINVCAEEEETRSVYPVYEASGKKEYLETTKQAS